MKNNRNSFITGTKKRQEYVKEKEQEKIDRTGQDRTGQDRTGQDKGMRGQGQKQ
jgi:hypothetical protein